ncbi:hypothetical protein ACFL5P_01705, partial [candidate division KSB1 bacterium]
VEGVSDEERYNQLLNGIPPRGGREVGSVVYRSDDGGKNWYKTHTERPTVGGGPGYYYNSIRIDPNDPDHVYVLATSMTHSTDGGKTWGSPFRFGGDNHAMWINPENSDHMMLGYDHGLGVTFDGGRNWMHPDNLPLAQFYAIGVDMDYPYNVYGGLQDNGSKKGPSTKRDGGRISYEDWRNVGGGDGMHNQVDYTDSRWLYNESQNGSISRINQVTGERAGIRASIQGQRFRYAWNAPIHISPHNPKVIYHGSQFLLRSMNQGDAWEMISPDLTTNDPAKIQGTGNITYCTISSISESPVKPGVIWCGTDDGNIQLTQDNGQTWTLLNDNIPDNPGYWVSRVTASNHFAGTAYISYWGYKYDDFKPYVYKTSDFGQTWTYIGNNLPQETVNVIKEDHKNPNLLFAGTSKAVYVSIDAGINWTMMKNNMPTQPIHDLVIHPRENDLVVGTHGRGIFIADIAPLQELNRNVLSQSAYLFDPETKVKWVSAGNNETDSQNYNGESEPVGSTFYYFLGNSAREVSLEVLKGERVVTILNASNNPGMNKVVWSRFTGMTPEQIEAIRNPPPPIPQQQGQRGGRGGAAAMGGRGGRGGGRGGGITVWPGEYTVKLIVDGREFTNDFSILQDYWYNK